MIKGFSDYLVEDAKVAYFTFGRMNPPTMGHEKLMDNLSTKAGKNPYFVFLSQTQDKKKNPLDYNAKIKHARKMFPRHARRIMANKKIRTAFDAASYLYDQGYTKVVMIVGSDRIREFDMLLNKYNGTKGRHGFYNFKTIDIQSAGARDPDAEGVEGMSASKLRDFAGKNDYTSFAQGLGAGVSNKDSKKLFLDVRKGMGLKEETEFKRHVELAPVSEAREKFVKGELFTVGEQVVVKDTDEVGTISHLGSNYVIVQLGEEKFVRKWLEAVEAVDECGCDGGAAGSEFIPTPTATGSQKITPPTKKKRLSLKDKEVEEVAQDSDIKDREGSQPAKYHKGLSKAMKQRRDAQFKKQAKMSDKNPKAYKPAPGDATAKTRKSKYTNKFKDMYGDK